MTTGAAPPKRTPSTVDGGKVDAGTSGLDASTAIDAGATDAEAAHDASPHADAAAADAGSAVGPSIYAVSLSPAQETMSCAAAGASALASATVSIVGDKIAVTVTYSGLSGAPVAGHIHYGAAGSGGPVVLPFANLMSPITAVFSAADYPKTVPENLPKTYEAFLAELRAGKTYLNLHTMACPGGEVRGQIE